MSAFSGCGDIAVVLSSNGGSCVYRSNTAYCRRHTVLEKLIFTGVNCYENFSFESAKIYKIYPETAFP